MQADSKADKQAWISQLKHIIDLFKANAAAVSMTKIPTV